MFLPLGLVAGHRVQRNSVDAAEDAVFNIRIVAHQAAQQQADRARDAQQTELDTRVEALRAQAQARREAAVRAVMDRLADA